MKVFIGIKAPVGSAIAAIINLKSSGLMVVTNQEDAELVVVETSSAALDILKEYEDVKVLLVAYPGWEGESVRSAAKGLQKGFPGRVYMRPVVRRDGEEDLVSFLINFKE